MLVFQALFPQKPSISEERVKLYVLCTCGHGRVYTQEVPFAQPAQGEPSLGHPQSSLLLIWYLGMLEQAEESKCREEELYGGQRGAGCVVLGIFRGHPIHIHEEARGFCLLKKSFQTGHLLYSLFTSASP